MQTSKENVYAAGDSCAVFYNPAKQLAYSTCNKCGSNGSIGSKEFNKPNCTVRYMGTQGTSALKIYNLKWLQQD